MQYVSEKVDPEANRKYWEQKQKQESERFERNRVFNAVFELGLKAPLRHGETLIERYEALKALEKHHREYLSKERSRTLGIAPELWDEFMKYRLQVSLVREKEHGDSEHRDR